MKQVLLTAGIFLMSIISNTALAQASLSKEEATDYAERFNLAGGTYQIQIIDSREKPSIQLSLIDQIDAIRKENVVAYISLKENIRIKVLPLSVINAEDFTAVERIVYLNSSEI